MPQGRRKQPFTGKQKKEQLRERRARSKSQARASDSERTPSADSGPRPTLTAESVAKINAQPDCSGRRDVNRYALHFFRESDQELSARKKDAERPFTRVPPEGLQVTADECWPAPELGLPTRPPWHFSMSAAEVDARENKSFREYLERVEKAYGSLTGLSHFELNLETWRQLWRVTEMADIVLLVADVRHPLFHLPPALFRYVTRCLHKDFVVVLNKADLVEAPLVVAWTDYLKRTFPGVRVVPFASYAGVKRTTRKGRRLGNLRMAADSCKRLYEACNEIVGGKLDLKDWIDKIHEELRSVQVTEESDEEAEQETKQEVVKSDTSYYQADRFKDGILTIGCVGHPNVGKSSVLNAIMGRKVVSVSRTPGHTKYFQTIFITPTVKLVDCPGLVFPSRIPKAMQVLMGCFPIAQLREPYTAVQYLAQRLDLPHVLKLTHPEPEAGQASQQWTAFDVCEAWALKRGFKTAKAARPDVYRAANHLLRMALDGRTLCLAFYPQGYVADRQAWASHADVKEIEQLQCRSQLRDDEQLDDVESDADGEPLAPAATSARSNAIVKATKKKKQKQQQADQDEEEGQEREIASLGSRVNKFALLKDDE